MATQDSPNTRRPQSQENTTFQQLENYPWDTDAEFQSGLHAILGSNPTPDQAEHLTLRARSFYFSRKNNVSIDFDAYQTWRVQHASSPYAHTNGNNATIEQSLPSNTEQGISTSLSNDHHEPGTAPNSTQQSAPYPTSFSEIVTLITEGRPIPGIKEVPDTVLDAQASQQNTSKRKKPWEENDARVGEEAGVMINVS